MTQSAIPIFLGVSSKVGRHELGWDIINLSHLTFLPYFPRSLFGLHCILGISKPFFHSLEQFHYRISFIDDSNPLNQSWCEQTIVLGETEMHPAEQPKAQLPNSWAEYTQTLIENRSHHSGELVRFHNDNTIDTAYEIIPINISQLVVHYPTTISIVFEREGARTTIGRFSCAFREPPPITPEERLAIESNPSSSTTITMTYTCQICKEQYAIYSALNPETYRTLKMDVPGVLLPDAPDIWRCKNGCSKFDIRYIKKGVHDMYRRPLATLSSGLGMSFTSIYQKRHLSSILEEYQMLIHSSPTEEAVQKFMEAKSIIWAFLSPRKILHKPSILTQHKADFAILTSQKILYFVEIEKPQTKIATKEGNLHSDLQKGVNQIRDWSLVVGDHKAALLDQLNFKPDDVLAIRYILIAGLQHATSPDALRKLQHNPPVQNTLLYCFDELAAWLHVLEGCVESL